MLKTFLQENHFIIPSYQYYGGMTGFQDYEFNGLKLKSNLIDTWRKLMLDQNILEVELPTIIPYSVLKSSGHVDRFTDYVVYDQEDNCYRADHLAKKWFVDHSMIDLETQVDSWDRETLEENINKFSMLEIESGKRIIVQTKNLILETKTNFSDSVSDFLRPELAQGIFVNFKTYQSYFQHENSPFVPFGVAQVGKSYRKEISPQSYTRMREFTQAEIEYFFDPINPIHANFSTVENIKVPLLTADMQLDSIDKPIYVTVGDALKGSLINHQLMAYFIAKLYKFAKELGLQFGKIRFRQHLKNEMSHYANQCWDLECLVNNSWLECIGCADRGSYDLTAHSKFNPKQPLNGKRKLSTPITKIKYQISVDVSKLPETYKVVYNTIKNYLIELDQEIASRIISDLNSVDSIELTIDNQQFRFEKGWLKISKQKITIEYEDFIPHVLEPSVGVDRLFYAILDQNVWQRDINERRLVLTLNDRLALYDIAVQPLYRKENMIQIADKIKKQLTEKGFKCYLDNSNTTIGKRYIRCDEIGVKNVITVDTDTLINSMVSLRDRDTMRQVFIHMDDILKFLIEKIEI